MNKIFPDAKSAIADIPDGASAAAAPLGTVLVRAVLHQGQPVTAGEEGA